MQTDWLLGLIGGGLIGVASTLFLLVNGRIMGASGLIWHAISGSRKPDWAENVALVTGLIIAPMLITFMFKQTGTGLTSNWAIIIVAGFLVGLGTRLANGCTSGHGVCGISRLSLRGTVATIIYMAAGAITVVIFKHALGVI